MTIYQLQLRHMRYIIISTNSNNIQWALSLRNELFLDEFEHYNSIDNPVIKQERLLGMCLAKKLVGELLNIPFASTHIVYNSLGKPTITIKGQHISISHTPGWVACVINDSPVGIDIENLSAFKKELPLCVFSNNEREYINSVSCFDEVLYRQCQIWTFKEAYYKAFGSGIPSYKSISFFDYEHLCYQRLIDNCFMTIFKAM